MQAEAAQRSLALQAETQTAMQRVVGGLEERLQAEGARHAAEREQLASRVWVPAILPLAPLGGVRRP